MDTCIKAARMLNSNFCTARNYIIFKLPKYSLQFSYASMLADS